LRVGTKMGAASQSWIGELPTWAVRWLDMERDRQGLAEK
jgi:hypothetical protein